MGDAETEVAGEEELIMLMDDKRDFFFLVFGVDKLGVINGILLTLTIGGGEGEDVCASNPSFTKGEELLVILSSFFCSTMVISLTFLNFHNSPVTLNTSLTNVQSLRGTPRIKPFIPSEEKSVNDNLPSPSKSYLAKVEVVMVYISGSSMSD
jgi:hypothetical protein